MAAAAAYLGALTARAWWALRRGEHRTTVQSEPSTRFAVLIPAHDEELLIGDTLRSLERQRYPEALYAVHVVADHCGDDTASVVRSHRAEVHELNTQEGGGKGPALAWLLDRLNSRGEEFDAVAVVDADTLVDERFLAVMDSADRFWYTGDSSALRGPRGRGVCLHGSRGRRTRHSSLPSPARAHPSAARRAFTGTAWCSTPGC